MTELKNYAKALPWLSKIEKLKGTESGLVVKMLLVGRNAKVPAGFLKTASSSEKAQLKQKSSMVKWVSGNTEYWVLQCQVVDPKDHYGLFCPSPYAMARDLVGTCFRQIIAGEPKSFSMEHVGESEDEFLGACVGLEMAQYRFKNVWPKAKPLNFKTKITSSLKSAKQLMAQAAVLGESVNLARFLVDLPPNLLQPQSYVKLLQAHFSKNAKTKVTVWDAARLKKEKMGLHLAVGQAASQEPQMVHVEYRGGGKEKPIAFVGKGITFDAGGLDIKPAAGMRNMKKDMGGSASVAGLAHWVVQSRLELNCDFYFAIAENAVGTESFRPGDVITSRSGKTVEIHNTDAEGRLVLADSLTVATEKKPQMVIDVATLTGAIKVGLGGLTPGLFSNSDNLAECLLRSGQSRGDVCWRMPLVPGEKSRLKSDVADMVNCTDGYGGAVTAALFLEKFTDGVPWAHFDIYAWMDSAKGPFATSGGSGQVVQALSHFLEQEAQNQKS